MPPKVSVIVPVRNGEETLPGCLESLLKLNYPEDRLEIIVVDNDSRDSTKEIVRRYPVRYLFEGTPGSYTARNSGISHATGDLLAFTDSDCIVDADWLRFLVPHFDNSLTGAAGGKIAASAPKTALERYQDRHVLDQKAFSMADPPFIATANALYRKDLLEKLGGFDASFFSGGDTDLGWRIHWEGHEIRYDARAVVYHGHRTKVRELFGQFFRYGQGNAGLFKKHKKKLGRKYSIRLSGYRRIFADLFFRLPVKSAGILFSGADDRCDKLLESYYRFVQTSGFKCGSLFGSIRHRVIYL